jgi:hypothetical protein
MSCPSLISKSVVYPNLFIFLTAETRYAKNGWHGLEFYSIHLKQY